MQDMMLIKNVLYGLVEVTKRTFVLKSDVAEALKAEGPEFQMPKAQDSIKLNGKYYAYFKVKQNSNDKNIPTPPEVHPEGS